MRYRIGPYQRGLLRWWYSLDVRNHGAVSACLRLYLKADQDGLIPIFDCREELLGDFMFADWGRLRRGWRVKEVCLQGDSDNVDRRIKREIRCGSGLLELLAWRYSRNERYLSRMVR